MGIPVIYLSAAPTDLRTHRARAEKILTSAGLDVVTLEAVRSKDWSQIRKNLRQELRQCSAVVHFAGLCYGSEPSGRPPGAPRRSHAQMEYHLARDLRIPTYPFVLPGGFPFDAHSPEPVEEQYLQEEHRQFLVSQMRLDDHVETAAQLDQRLYAIAHELLQRGQPRTPATSPPRRSPVASWLLRLPLLLLMAALGWHLWNTSRESDPQVRIHAPGALLAGLSPDEIAAEQEQAVLGVLETTRLAREVAQITPQQGTWREQYDPRTKQELAIASVAARHGKDPNALQSSIHEWARSTRASGTATPLDKALAAYLLADFDVAGEEAGRVAETAEGSTPPNHPLALSGWFLQGHCRLQQLKFLGSLDSYRRAFAHTSVKNQPLIWSDLGLAEAQALMQLGRWNEALPSFKTALRLRTTHLPPDAPELAWAMTALAPLLAAMDKPEEAETLLRNSCTILQQRFGPEHPEVAVAVANLGEALRLSGKAPEAEATLCQAIAMHESLQGKEAPEIARVLGGLARLVAGAGRQSEAVLLGEKAVSINERKFGPNHPRVARDLTNLALILAPQDHPRSVELQRRALAIMEKQFGPEHAETASALNNLAGLLQHGPESEEAEQMFRAALKIDESLFGRSHPNLLRDLRNLAGLLRESGRRDESIACYLQALGLAEVHFGKDHSETITSLRQLSLQLAEARRFVEAEPFGRRALASATGLYGPDHMEVAYCSRDLAFCLAVSGKLEEAATLYANAQAITERQLGADHISVFHDIRNQAAVLRDLGDKPRALEAYRRAYAMARRILGQEHPQTLIAMDNLACMLRDTKHYEDAEYLFRDLLAAREKLWGQDNADLANDLSDLAGVLFLKSRHAEAEPFYRRALKLVATGPKDATGNRPLINTARQNYSSNLRRLGVSENEIAARMRRIESGEAVDDLASTSLKP